MTEMRLQWRRPDPALTLAWRGPDDSIRAALDNDRMVQVPTVIGPPGIGGGGGSSLLSRIAESDVSGHRAVAASADGRVSHVGKADVDASNVMGISTGSALAAQSVSIQPSGEMQESSWNWSPGPVWLGDNGLLTQTLPTSGLLVRIGIATAPTKLNVNPQVIAQL